MNTVNPQDSCVVLYSGGMDSTVVLYHALQKHHNVFALIVDYGQKHSIETEIALKCINNLKSVFEDRLTYKIVPLFVMGTKSSLLNSKIEVPKMKDIIGDPQASTYVPNRNMLFLSLAASFAESIEASTIYYGAAKADDTSGYWDCTSEFRTLMNQILKLNRRNLIQIEAPLIDKTKQEIIQYGLSLGVDFSTTHTCYTGESKACGECPSCSARVMGFIKAGYIDPVKYSIEFPWERFNCKLCVA